MVEELIVWCKSGKSKIGNADLKRLLVNDLFDQDIVKLNVPVDDLLLLKEVQS